MTVRIPDELAAFVDDAVRRHDASSRAAVITRALARERRRFVAENDARILAAAASHDDLDGLAEVASRTPLSDLD